jgi:hypothetical protein
VGVFMVCFHNYNPPFVVQYLIFIGSGIMIRLFGEVSWVLALSGTVVLVELLCP